MSGLLIAGGLMAALGIALSCIVAVANKTLAVIDDPRIDGVESMLPGINCGACGFPGCRALAENIVNGAASPAQCSVCSSTETMAIAAYLGVDAGTIEKRVARLACAGGNNVAYTRAVYEGIETCGAASIVVGGGKGCVWGCLGYGDCEASCPFGAISMNEHRLPVVDEAKCTACGNCVDACPKTLFSIHPVSHRLWVACKNRAFGKAARSECAVACIGCGKCAKDAVPGLIEMMNNLPVIDYWKNDLAAPDAIQGCPTGAIVWVEPGGAVRKGAKAKTVTEKSALPVG
jgi:Na+-translocating ferredoxin:NAD+ oxidoreductase RNF subunit RnfB